MAPQPQNADEAPAYKYYNAIFKSSSTMLFFNYIFLSPLYRCPLNELSNGAWAKMTSRISKLRPKKLSMLNRHFKLLPKMPWLKKQKNHSQINSRTKSDLVIKTMIREEILKMPVVVEDAHSLDKDNRIYILQYFNLMS